MINLLQIVRPSYMKSLFWRNAEEKYEDQLCIIKSHSLRGLCWKEMSPSTSLSCAVMGTFQPSDTTIIVTNVNLHPQGHLSPLLKDWYCMTQMYWKMAHIAFTKLKGKSTLPKSSRNRIQYRGQIHSFNQLPHTILVLVPLM